MCHSKLDYNKKLLIQKEYRKWLRIWVAITKEEDGMNEAIMDILDSHKGEYLKELRKQAHKYKNNKYRRMRKERDLFVSLSDISEEI